MAISYERYCLLTGLTHGIIRNCEFKSELTLPGEELGFLSHY